MEEHPLSGRARLQPALFYHNHTRHNPLADAFRGWRFRLWENRLRGPQRRAQPPCWWFRRPNPGRINRSSGLARVGESGVGQPNRRPIYIR